MIICGRGEEIYEMIARLTNFNSNGLRSISRTLGIPMQKGKFSLRLRTTPIF